MIGAALKALLVGDATIQALISGRAYPVHSVQEPTAPFVTFQRISATRQLSHSGSTHVVEALFQFSCWGSTPSQSQNLAKAVVAKFHALKAVVGSEEIMLSRIVNEVELYDEDAASYQVAVDISIAYRE